LLLLFLAALALVAYLSLFPWEFGPPRASGHPLWVVLQSWPLTSARRFVLDVATNVIIYVPIGVFGYLSSRKAVSRGTGAALAIVCGAALSAAIEVAQVFTPFRVPSAVDLLSNVAGTAVGVAGAALLERWLRARRVRVGIALTARSGGALLLLCCFVAYLVYPAVPQASLPMLLRKLRALASLDSLSVPELAAAVADWSAAAVLLNHALGARLALPAFCGLLLLVPARLVIFSRVVTWTDLMALPLALAARSGLVRSGVREPAIAAAALGLGILIRGAGQLAPAPASFSWIPFGTILSYPAVTSMLLLKTFRYGALIWLLRAAGWPLPVAAVCVAAMLSALEAIQVWMPTHVAEVTDPFLALMAGLVLFTMERYYRRSR
jgi:VanZ family protein